MDRSHRVADKYIYHSLYSEGMDKIQKRKGYVRSVTAMCLVTIILVLLFYRKSGTNKAAHFSEKVPYNRTSEQNDEDSQKIPSILHISTVFSLWIFAYVAANFLHRVCLLMEELSHRKTRYNGSYKKLLIAVFYGSWNIKYFFGSVPVVGFACFRDHNVVLDTCHSHLDMLTMAVAVLLVWFACKRWSDTEFEHSASCAPCLGKAMAYGIYYNYYEHVLHELRQRIEEAEKYFNITIPLKKLILLFPSSGVNQSQLDDGNEDLSKVGELRSVQVDRSGTMSRKMTNPIYRVSPKEMPPFYCVVEGINCLSTLKEMNLPEDVFTEQAHLLYITLKQILDQSPYKNSYTLLCYEDDDDSERLSAHLWVRHQELLNK